METYLKRDRTCRSKVCNDKQKSLGPRHQNKQALTLTESPLMIMGMPTLRHDLTVMSKAAVDFVSKEDILKTRCGQPQCRRLHYSQGGANQSVNA